jgi:hypothetical protein
MQDTLAYQNFGGMSYLHTPGTSLRTPGHTAAAAVVGFQQNNAAEQRIAALHMLALEHKGKSS